MTNSTFYRDGYKDGLEGNFPTEPDISVYAAEYKEGYKDGVEAFHMMHLFMTWNEVLQRRTT